MKKFFNRGAIKKKSGGDDTNHQDGDLSNSSQQQQQQQQQQIVTPPDVQLRIQPDRIQSEQQHEGQRRQPLHKSDYPPQQLPKEAKQYLSNNYSSSGPAIGSIGANTGGFVQEAPGLPGEDRNGIERLTGESDEQYVARQTHLREEARARMAAKFGSGGLSGNNSTSSAPTSSNSGLMIGRSGSGGSAPSPSPFANNNANTTSYGGLQEAVGMPGEDRNGIERLTGESDEQYVRQQQQPPPQQQPSHQHLQQQWQPPSTGKTNNQYKEPVVGQYEMYYTPYQGDSGQNDRSVYAEPLSMVREDENSFLKASIIMIDDENDTTTSPSIATSNNMSRNSSTSNYTTSISSQNRNAVAATAHPVDVDEVDVNSTSMESNWNNTNSSNEGGMNDDVVAVVKQEWIPNKAAVVVVMGDNAKDLDDSKNNSTTSSNERHGAINRDRKTTGVSSSSSSSSSTSIPTWGKPSKLRTNGSLISNDDSLYTTSSTLPNNSQVPVVKRSSLDSNDFSQYTSSTDRRDSTNQSSTTTTTTASDFPLWGKPSSLPRSSLDDDDDDDDDNNDKNKLRITPQINAPSTNNIPLWGKPSVQSNRLTLLGDEDDETAPSNLTQKQLPNKEVSTPPRIGTSSLTVNGGMETTLTNMKNNPTLQEQISPVQTVNPDENDATPLWGRRSEKTNLLHANNNNNNSDDRLLTVPSRPTQQINAADGVPSPTEEVPLWGKKPGKKSLESDNYVVSSSSAPWVKKKAIPMNDQDKKYDGQYKNSTLEDSDQQQTISQSTSPTKFVPPWGKHASRDDNLAAPVPELQGIISTSSLVGSDQINLKREVSKKKISFKLDFKKDERVGATNASNSTDDKNKIPLWGKPASNKTLLSNPALDESESANLDESTNESSRDNLPTSSSLTNDLALNDNNPSKVNTSHRTDLETKRQENTPSWWKGAEQGQLNPLQGYAVTINNSNAKGQNPTPVDNTEETATKNSLLEDEVKEHLQKSSDVPHWHVAKTKAGTESNAAFKIEDRGAFSTFTSTNNSDPYWKTNSPTETTSIGLDQYIPSGVAKLPSPKESGGDDSWPSSVDVPPPLGQGKTSDQSFSIGPMTGPNDRPMVSPQPLWGKKAKKHASLEDEPDVREIAFAEGIIGAIASSPPSMIGLPGVAPVTGLPSVKDSSPKANYTPDVSPVAKKSEKSSLDSDKKLDDGKDDTNRNSEGDAADNANQSWDDKATSSARLDVNPDGLSEEELLKRALLASKEEHKAPYARLSPDDIEDAKGNARTVRTLIASNYIDLSFLQTLLTMCKEDQKRVAQDIEAAMMMNIDSVEDVDPTTLETLIDLNGQILEVIESGEKALHDQVKPPPSKPAPSKGAVNLDVQDLVRKKDIFSLICMLRVHDKAKRLDTTMALMRFSRAAELEGGSENIRLRDEIRSSGGLHSLLTLFRTRDTLYELKVVAALAVAYLLPSFVESSTHSSPSLGLKIVECLRFLVNKPRSVSPNGSTIDTQEMYNASLNALTSFWVNHLEPMMNSKKTTSILTVVHDENNGGLERNVSLGGRLRPGRAANESGVTVFAQRQEAIALDELLEMTVSLIIHFARKDQEAESDLGLDMKSQSKFGSGRSSTYSCTLIEQVCAVELARPIAVRGGILQILVSWIMSSDPEKVRPAVSALCSLTSINDKYMAGWIHSEMVNKGAVKGLANLTHDISITHGVRVATVQILSSLCTAPHTRAAVVEEDCINFFVGFLYEYTDKSSKEAALYAGNAILQLAAGAMTRASAFGAEDLELRGWDTIDRLDTLLDDIVNSGVIASIISIALNGSGQLRLVAVQTLRVISEDTSPSRQTRLQLCDYSAAMSLGATLKDDVGKLSTMLLSELIDIPPNKENSLKELHEALFALANILEPIQDVLPPKILRARSSMTFSEDRLMKGCLDTANSGGLESLLKIASVPFMSSTKPVDLWQNNIELVEGACRSLALISPLLLSNNEMSKGYTKWAHDLLLCLHHVLIQIASIEKFAETSDRAVDLYVNVLQGMGALARSDPLKVRIVDTCLPQLLQAKGVTDPTDVSNAASQVFQSLGFAEDEVAVQVAGNNPNVLADWFCLQRSLLIQAMARAEIRQLVSDIWEEPFQQTSQTVVSKLMRDSSSYLAAQSGSEDSVYLFENVMADQSTAKSRESLVSQYKEIYENRKDNDSGDEHQSNLLSKQMFPLNSCLAERNWILKHGASLNQGSASTAKSLSEHVEKLMAYCIPSRLLLDDVFPVNILRPDSSFDCRAFMMPRRRYFSFRREGQLLSRLCDMEFENSDFQNAHWTLGFTNSSFAGEFSESLIQALYICPMIFGLSFSRNIDYPDLRESESEGKENQLEDQWGGLLISTLGGSLPPWISHLTFDGLFEDRELMSFVSLLETMSKLSGGQSNNEWSHQQAQSRGKFLFLAICNSPNVAVATWRSFINLIGSKKPSRGVSEIKPLSSLKGLDLSGNRLGDEVCASILEIVYCLNSKCCLEKLDLSGNCIRNAPNVLRVLRQYAQQKLTLTKNSKYRTPLLHTLRLESNELHLGKSWIEVLSLLGNDGIEWKFLDISNNDLLLMDNELEYASIISEAIWSNSTLCRLDLSNNCFSSNSLDYIFGRLAEKEYVLTTLSFRNNLPELTKSQMSALYEINTTARRNNIQKYYFEMDQPRASSEEEYMDLHDSFVSADTDAFSQDAVSLYGQTITSALTMDSNLTSAAPPSKPGDNMITVLFSAPLVFNDGHCLRPFAKLDFDMERELMWQCLKEASRDIELSFDSATHDRLLATITKRCSCLHYSGHGHQEYLPFEDGAGGPYWFKVDQFKDLIAKEGGAPFRFVFVSACYSYLAGATFASAGVPHVVCCQQESELKDTAALAFTRQFYLALSVGHTVKESFEQGCKAVRATPNLKNPDMEMKKFLLLPEDGNHDVPIFNAKPVAEWPKPLSYDASTKSRRAGLRPGKSRSTIYAGGAKSSELSVRNMMQEDPSPSPPQFFLGREVDMYYVLKAVLGKRLVSIIGEPGVGRSSLACALCHYINERASTILAIERIYFVKARRSRKKNPFKVVVTNLLKKLDMDDEKSRQDVLDGEMEAMFDEICKVLKHEKALVVFDRAEILVDADDANEFPLLLSKLCRETKNVKVLLTNRFALGIPSLGEHPITLGPLNFAETVRLFSKNCPYVHTPADRRKLFDSLVISPEEGELLATDPGLGGTITKKIFELIGDGIPYKIEKAAYDLTKEDFLKLVSRKV